MIKFVLLDIDWLCLSWKRLICISN